MTKKITWLILVLLLLINNELTTANAKIDTLLKVERSSINPTENAAVIPHHSTALMEPSSRIYGVSFFYFVSLLSSFALQTLSRQATLLFNMPLIAATRLNNKLLGIVFNIGILWANLNKPLLVFLALPMFASVALAIATVLAGFTLPIGKRYDFTNIENKPSPGTEYNQHPETFNDVINNLNENNFKLNAITDTDEYFKKNNSGAKIKYLHAKPREGLPKIKWSSAYPVHRMKKLIAILRLRIAYLTKTG